MSSSNQTPMPMVYLMRTGRPYWLPPTGRGNGLSAAFWSPIAQVPQAMVDPLLHAMFALSIPGWAAPVNAFRERHPDDPEVPYDVWVATARFDLAEEAVMLFLHATTVGRHPLEPDEHAGQQPPALTTDAPVPGPHRPRRHILHRSPGKDAR